jgi:hypothetical protein
MVDLPTIRRLALAFPGAEDTSDAGRVTVSVGGKGFVWSYLARSKPKARREPVPGVLAVRCPIEKKEILIEAAPDRFFDDDHYRGYPAVLVRLDAIEEDEFGALLEASWRLTTSKRPVRRKAGSSDP